MNRVDRPAHDQQPRQVLDEDGAHPRRHRVRLRRPEVHVQHDDGDADAAQMVRKTNANAVTD